MNILLVNFKSESKNEINEYFRSQGYTVFTAQNDLEAVRILNSENIHEAIIRLTKIMNIGLINYINHHFKYLRTILVMNRYVEEAFSVIKKSGCEIINEPYTLSDFQNTIRHIEQPQHA
ncbi:MAG TPA: hypothetical protein ENG70_03635 [Candidatus Cloacimonetes bacterium]|nr:hypothetical protein [Candidatus Cloacimonadota bacterium]HEX37935.1 hypothetical protein [Candidatus Cloacimonadota bacterium]